MTDFLNQCFVCGEVIEIELTAKNTQLNLPVCNRCKDTDSEKIAVNEHLEGMADGFVCGCI